MAMNYPCFILLIIGSAISNSKAQNQQQYDACGELFQCGDIADIGYPFWGGNRPEFCGLSAFKLNCTVGDAQPRITIMSRDYRVLAINKESWSLTVVRNEFFDNVCPESPQNATLDTSFFNYAADITNLTLIFGCRAILNNIQNSFDCAGSDNNNNVNISNNSYVPTSMILTIGAAVESGFNYSIDVQVNKTSGDAMLKDTPTIGVKAALKNGFGLVWSANNMACDSCVRSNGRCGSSVSGSFVCYCIDGDHGGETCGNINKRKFNDRFTLGITLAIGLPIILLIIVTIIIRVYILKRKGNRTTMVDQFMKNYGSNVPKRYSYRQIENITKLFVDKQGQGGFGTVYKGKLPNGQLVAVKLLKEEEGDSRDFMNEVESISVTSHVNVVSLLGFCYQGKKRALVYEFMPNGSLDRFICNDPSLRLGMKLLYRIVIGIARGLEYLHQGCATRIVHFDIKPHNILLDEEFCPKISDFGLAKLCKKKQSIMSTVNQRGTIGYIAPEVFSRAFGKASHKSDVYSFGMMVLEMLGAKEIKEDDQTSEVYFPDCIYERVVKGKDLKLPDATTEEEKEMGEKMILVGLWCIQINPLQRPSIGEVVKMLEGNVDAIEIPPEPFKFSPSRAIINDSSDSSSSLSQIQ